MTYQARQHETFGPIPDNDWTDCDEETARYYLGSTAGACSFAIARADMERGHIVTYCGLVDFRMIEKG